jgi:tRNA threonylcarbamoyladenosine biosynthesis protein TsaB
MPLILCIETSTTVCSVCLASGVEVISDRWLNEGYSHSAKLNLFINEILEEAGHSIKELDAIAVSAGPGSYTGLRIGVSTAKGLAFALDKPLISVPSLMAIASGTAEQFPAQKLNYSPMIDAGRMEVYCALYNEKLEEIIPAVAVIITEDFLSEFAKDKKISISGDGAEKCKAILSGRDNFIFADVLPSANYMSRIVADKFAVHQFEDVSAFAPFYLKEYVPGAAKKLY